MRTLSRNQEDKLRRGLGLMVDETPPGRDLTELTQTQAVPVAPSRRVGAWMGAAAFVVVLALFSPLLFIGGSDPNGERVVPAETTPAVSTPVPAGDPNPEEADRFPVVQQVEETGDLIGLMNGHAFISADGGETWNEILVDGGADLIGLSPDGSVVAVKNGDERLEGEFGVDSFVREAPEVLRYDPEAGEWHRNELPRPDMPIDDPTPAPTDGTGECPKGGFQWHWGALSMAAVDQMVIAGEHRVVADGVCDEAFQFFWTSPDGEAWQVIDDTEIDGYLVGLTSFNDRYIAYGSATPWFRWELDRLPQVWSSTDLATWQEAALDLSVLPDRAYASLFPDNERSYGIENAVGVTTTRDSLSLSIPVAIALPGPDASITNVDELREWVNQRDPGMTVDLEATLESLDVTFPIDDEELDTLSGFFAAANLGKRLILTTTDGDTWTSRYGNN